MILLACHLITWTLSQNPTKHSAVKPLTLSLPAFPRITPCLIPNPLAGVHWPGSTGRGPLAGVHWPGSTGRGPLAGVHWPGSTGRGPLAGVHWPGSTGRGPLAGVHWPGSTSKKSKLRQLEIAKSRKKQSQVHNAKLKDTLSSQ